jgi:DNA-directed RNA polymerase specialized sigma24 family protein
MLGCSRGTVKSTAHRALKSLKAALDEQDGTDEHDKAASDRKEA